MSTVAKPPPSSSFISLENLLLDYPVGVILRSQDSYEFLVPKLNIIHSSPILREELLTSPTNPEPGASAISTKSDVKGSTGTANAHQVIQLPVTGAILNSLLSYIFPVPPILPSTTEQVMDLLSVAQMYKMDTVLTHIRNHIAQQQPPLIRKETAFSIYALAQKNGLRTETLQAARCTLSFLTMNMCDLAKEDKLGLMPGAFLHELWKYHQRARSNLTSDMEEFKTSQLEEFKEQEDSDVCEFSTDENLPYWLEDYISKIGSDSVPAFFDFTDFHLKFVEHSEGLESKYGDKCFFCMKITQKSLHALWETLMTVVQGSIAKAESDFALGIEETRSGNESQVKLSMEDSSPLKYSDMPSADVILQSSDLVDFRVHRSVLVKSSPFFRDMFSLPQPSSDAPDELPVVRVSEIAEVLNSLVSMLYHVPPEMPHSNDNILALLAATDKYDMGAVQSSIRSEVSRKELLSPTDSSRVFHVYAVACNKRLVPEMEAAARLTLDYPMTFESVGEALRLFDGWALPSLADFRLRYARNLTSRIKSFFDSQNGPSKIWVDCPSAPRRDTPPHPLPWWLGQLFYSHLPSDREYDSKFFAEAPPTTAQIRDEFLESLQDHINKNGCHFCSKVYTLKGKEYCAEIDDMLEQARNLPLLTSGDVPGV